MILNILRRSRTLRTLLRSNSNAHAAYQSHAYHLRAHLSSNRLSAANGFGFQSLSIAGTNKIFSTINTTNLSIPNNFNINHTSHRNYRIAFDKHSPGAKGESHNPNWNKNEIKRIEYDTSKELKNAFPETESIMDASAPNKNSMNKKRFDFEYLQYLQQKYRGESPMRSNKRGKRGRNKGNNDKNLLSSQKRQFATGVEAEPGSAAQAAAQIQKDRIAAARLAAENQQQMAKEDEINPTSLGGMMVIAIGAAIFYWLYNVDNTKHAGISSFLSKFSRTVTLEELVEKQDQKPVHKIPDDWNMFKVIVDHFKNLVMGIFDRSYYNSEYIWSKLFRLFYIPSAKLLPPTKQNLYTLVIDLDTVCHSTWSRKEGFERTMRPYYSEFIHRMALSGWEVVLFGQCEDYDWMESPDFIKLDGGKGYVQQYLWNKDCYYFNGHRTKDLSRLGRDLKHVIAIDNDPRSIQLQPENGIILSRWTPEKEEAKPDNSLLQLIEFLEYLAKAEVADVRQVLAAYRGKDIAQEFRKRYFAAVQAQLQQGQGYDGDSEDNEEGEEEYYEEEEEVQPQM